MSGPDGTELRAGILFAARLLRAAFPGDLEVSDAIALLEAAWANDAEAMKADMDALGRSVQLIGALEEIGLAGMLNRAQGALRGRIVSGERPFLLKESDLVG